MESKINDKQGRYWNQSEHVLFLEGLKIFGARDLRRIALHVGTRSVVQTRTHAQKYFLKLEREKAKREKQEITNQKLRNTTQPESTPSSPASSPTSMNNSMSQLATAALFEMNASVSSPSSTNSPEAHSPQQGSCSPVFVQSFGNLPQLVQNPIPSSVQINNTNNNRPMNLPTFDESEALASLREFAANTNNNSHANNQGMMKFPSIANLLNDHEFAPSLNGTQFCRLPSIQLKD